MNTEKHLSPSLLENTVNALHVNGSTLINPDDKLPHQRGNCFNVSASDGKQYDIVNFNYENLEYLLSHGINWPIKMVILSERKGIIQDERIPDEWYDDKYCEVCCPRSLLPFQQIARHKRQEARGERVITDTSIIIDSSKRPKIIIDEKTRNIK